MCMHQHLFIRTNLRERTHIQIHAHMPTCFRSRISHKHRHSEDAVLICWLSEFSGVPNTPPLSNSAKKHRETEKKDREKERRNKSAGKGCRRGRWKKKINDFTPMFEKGEVHGKRRDVPDLQVPWHLPFMCRANYLVIFSGKNELTDALH